MSSVAALFGNGTDLLYLFETDPLHGGLRLLVSDKYNTCDSLEECNIIVPW